MSSRFLAGKLAGLLTVQQRASISHFPNLVNLLIFSPASLPAKIILCRISYLASSSTAKTDPYTQDQR